MQPATLEKFLLREGWSGLQEDCRACQVVTGKSPAIVPPSIMLNGNPVR